jgi:hypothetical protein
MEIRVLMIRSSMVIMRQGFACNSLVPFSFSKPPKLPPESLHFAGIVNPRYGATRLRLILHPQLSRVKMGRGFRRQGSENEHLAGCHRHLRTVISMWHRFSTGSGTN